MLRRVQLQGLVPRLRLGPRRPDPRVVLPTRGHGPVVVSHGRPPPVGDLYGRLLLQGPELAAGALALDRHFWRRPGLLSSESLLRARSFKIDFRFRVMD